MRRRRYHGGGPCGAGQTVQFYGVDGRIHHFMAVLSAHAKWLEQIRMRLEAISAETHFPEGNPPDA
jgi:hypothetical protein